jgi:antitoxin CcdA
MQARKSANLSLDSALVAEAKALNVNISRAGEEGVRLAVAQARTAQWLAENAEAIAAKNRWIEENGLPLAKYRMF